MSSFWILPLMLGACATETDSGWADPPVALTFGMDTPTVVSLEPVGDATGDGVDDLLVVGEEYDDDDGAVRLYLYEGGPGGPDDWPTQQVGLYAESGAVEPTGDLDGDGLGDLVIALLSDWDADVVLYLYGSSGGTLSSAVTTVFDGAQLSDMRVLQTTICGRADLDGDGLRDLVGVGFDAVTSGEATVLVFDAAQSPPALHSAGGIVEPMLASAGDLDGDGRDEIVLRESNEPTLGIMAGGPILQDLEVLPGPDLSGYDYVTSLVNTGDLDGDGQAELAIGLSDPATEVPLYAMRDGALERVSGRPSPTERGASFGEQVTALPLQGQPALAISDPWLDWSQGAVFLFRGEETSPSQSLPGGNETWGTGQLLEAVGDLNGDGAPDFAYSQQSMRYDLSWVLTVFPWP